MEPRYRLRLYILTALILVGFGALVSRLYDYQINQRAKFLKQVPSNFTITIREPGIRGEIKDRNGIVLAENIVNYEVIFNLQEIRDEYKRHLMETVGPEAFDDFRAIKTSDIIKKWVMPKLAIHNLDKDFSAGGLDTHYRTHGGLVPYTYRSDLDYTKFSHLAEHNLELAGVNIRVTPRRQYPYGSLCSHVLGYLNQWKKGEIPNNEKEKYKHYTGDSQGVSGVEKSMNRELTGAEGIKTLLKNEKGKILQVVDYIKPDAGASVHLNIDAKVQFLVQKTLRQAGRAAAVVMNPQTGEIIAMASVPDYTPNFFIPSISHKNWDNYRDNKADPLLNKAIGNFSPASTFKLPTAIAGAIHGQGNNHEHCPGYVAYGNIKIGCHNTAGHGTLSLQPAIEKSCNPYFMNIANKIGNKKMLSSFHLLKLGKKTGVELPGEFAGLLPGDLKWKKDHPGKSISPSETGMLGIGQDDSAATPLQIAAMTSAIANGGIYYQPRIIKEVISPQGDIIISNKPKPLVNLINEGLKASDLENIRKGMLRAVNGGTAKKAALAGRNVAAKTGTAQTTDLGLETNDAWTTAFAPYDNPKYVVVVAVKRGKSGGAVAGPLVRTILAGLFAQEEGLSLPLEPTNEFKGDFEIRDEIIISDLAGFINASVDEAVNEGPAVFISQPTIRAATDAEQTPEP